MWGGGGDEGVKMNVDVPSDLFHSNVIPVLCFIPMYRWETFYLVYKYSEYIYASCNNLYFLYNQHLWGVLNYNALIS